MVTSMEQKLRNPDIQPSNDVIASALGKSNNAYIKFIKELVNHDIHLEWRYYNDGKAWLAKGVYKWQGVRGGQKEMTVFWLSIWDDFFKLTFFCPERSREDLLNLPLSNKVKQMIKESDKMGKLKFFPLVFDLFSDEMFEDVFNLMNFKKSIK